MLSDTQPLEPAPKGLVPLSSLDSLDVFKAHFTSTLGTALAITVAIVVGKALSKGVDACTRKPAEPENLS
jgi:F0F1-type ATP synthase membrane subunit c/vacuolar-type H+-ATPase subunit K